MTNNQNNPPYRRFGSHLLLYNLHYFGLFCGLVSASVSRLSSPQLPPRFCITFVLLLFGSFCSEPRMSSTGSSPLAQEKFWANKAECEDAEYRYYAKLHGKVMPKTFNLKSVEKDIRRTSFDILLLDLVWPSASFSCILLFPRKKYFLFVRGRWGCKINCCTHFTNLDILVSCMNPGCLRPTNAIQCQKYLELPLGFLCV